MPFVGAALYSVLWQDVKAQSSAQHDDVSSSVSTSAEGKFPVSESGRCSHNSFWTRLRGKRGHSYFYCTYCEVPFSPTPHLNA